MTSAEWRKLHGWVGHVSASVGLRLYIFDGYNPEHVGPVSLIDDAPNLPSCCTPRGEPVGMITEQELELAEAQVDELVARYLEKMGRPVPEWLVRHAAGKRQGR